MNSQPLSIVTRTQGNNAALKNGTIKLPDLALDFIEIPVLVDAFRRMVRRLEFDICEMALTTYLCAREHGVEFTAIPIFLKRAFHHGAIFHNTDNPIKEPKQLEGCRIGVNRGYTVTAGVWARSILQEEYDVDLDKITWVLSGDEHVAEYNPPTNVVPSNSPQTLEELLITGDISAAINIQPTDPRVQSLIPDALERGLAAFSDRGHYPINHLIVIRNSVLKKHPGVATAIFNAFSEAKKLYLDKLSKKQIFCPSSTDNLNAQILELHQDPLPYGVTLNNSILENLIQHAKTQKILRHHVDINSLFVSETIDLTG
ncbi:MAG: 4,5-dihydroxyphthalate decarboxylase [Rhodospirillaceae bacterium]|nr:4,5-dihydroxyphthalate decarboxylase [Rhodospirillaceae bacterium]|tara:strand:- start:1509 stop:2453 length:945 start_codon:yes stop_codon:yes gene_type:complete